MIKNLLEQSLVLAFIMGFCFAVNETVYGKRGSSIIFTCPFRKTSTSSVAWFFVVSSSISAISDGNYTVENSPLYSRVSIVGNQTAGEYNLQLSDLRESDAEVYRCNVGFQQKEYKLELLAAPSSLTLQGVIPDNKIVGIEDQSLTLRCTATGGKPPPLVKITVGDNVPGSAEQTVTYTIPRLQRSYDKQIVHCDANSSALDSPMDATANLYLYLKPSQPTFSPDPISIEETRQLEVSCSSTGSRPQATFQWNIGRANVTSGATTQVTNIVDDTYTVISTLRHNIDRTYHGQSITCASVNVAAPNGIQASKTLDVKFAPKITVTNESYTQNSATRTVTCSPDGNPINYTYYRWQHKSTYGKTLIRELVGGKNLTLPSVPVEARYQDSGEYVCTASNGIRDRDGKIEQTGSGYVTVDAQPVFTSANNPTAYGVFGSHVDIHVYLYSVPIYTSLKWFIPSKQITNNEKYNLSESKTTVNDTFYNTTVQLNGYKVTMTIKNLEVSDFNVTYRVEVSNGVGQQFVPYNILLLSASGPQTPVNFTISSYSQFSISVQWYPGYNGGHEQTFFLQYRVYGSNMWQSAQILDTKQTRQTYTQDGLQDGTLYELRMYAENKFNTSSPTEPQTIETIKDSQASKMGPIIGGVAGGLAAVLIIIVILWFVIFKRKQDKSTPSKASRSKSDSDVPEGLQHNILYQSAGSDFKPLVPKAETGKKDKKPSTSETEYAEVQKPNAVYAAVDKTVQKNVEDKKQKDKKKRPKKPGKKVNKAGNDNEDGEYANNGMSLKDMGEGEYANAEDRSGPQTSHKNLQGLEYADLSFTKQIPQKGKKPVIHGGEDRTLYSEVDHTKKAPPPPQESAYEETNFKHG